MRQIRFAVVIEQIYRDALYCLLSVGLQVPVLYGTQTRLQVLGVQGTVWMEAICTGVYSREMSQEGIGCCCKTNMESRITCRRCVHKKWAPEEGVMVLCHLLWIQSTWLGSDEATRVTR